jgi:hypothetical protein
LRETFLTNPSAEINRIETKERAAREDRREEPFRAKFDLKATTSRGEARNDFGSAMQSETAGAGAFLGTHPDYWTVGLFSPAIG